MASSTRVLFSHLAVSSLEYSAAPSDLAFPVQNAKAEALFGPSVSDAAQLRLGLSPGQKEIRCEILRIFCQHSRFASAWCAVAACLSQQSAIAVMRTAFLLEKAHGFKRMERTASCQNSFTRCHISFSSSLTTIIAIILDCTRFEIIPSSLALSTHAPFLNGSLGHHVQTLGPLIALTFISPQRAKEARSAPPLFIGSSISAQSGTFNFFPRFSDHTPCKPHHLGSFRQAHTQRCPCSIQLVTGSTQQSLPLQKCTRMHLKPSSRWHGRCSSSQASLS